jgi:hypothetical protein
MDNNTVQNDDNSNKFLKNIGNKLSDEQNESVKTSSLNKELEGLNKINDAGIK